MGFIAGGLLQGVGSLMSSQADEANALERAQVARFNAAVAKQEAKTEMQTAAADAVDFRRQVSARLAAGRASEAGSGFVTDGSPLLINEAAVTEMEFGVQRIVGNAQTKAARLRTQSLLLTREGEMEDRNASYARQAGFIGLASGIMGGFTNMQRSSLLTSPAPMFG